MLISMVIGQQHIKLNRINSTNKYATDMVSKSKPIEGTVISASFQYDGRGQIGRGWYSSEGQSITCSTIMKPTFLKARSQFDLNIAVSLGVHDFISILIKDKPIYIKWPNDIYVNDLKIAGILIQNTLMGKHISTSVLGTGININEEAFPKELPNPTSIFLETKGKNNLEHLFPVLFKCLEDRYNELKTGNVKRQRLEYHKLLYKNGILSRFKNDEEEEFNGCIKGVNDSGQLCIKDEKGNEKSYSFREIKFVL